MIFDAKEMVGDVMRRKPATIRVFLRHGMACVGCPVAPFHTIEEAGAEYGLPVEALLRELAESRDEAEGWIS